MGFVVCRPIELKQMNSESNIEINMIAGISGVSMFKIGIQRRTDDITVATTVGGCMAESLVKRREQQRVPS